MILHSTTFGQPFRLLQNLGHALLDSPEFPWAWEKFIGINITVAVAPTSYTLTLPPVHDNTQPHRLPIPSLPLAKPRTCFEIILGILWHA